MARGIDDTRKLRDKLPTERQRVLFDQLLASGYRPQEAFRVALWR